VHIPQKHNRNTPKKQSTDKQPWYKAYKNLWLSVEVQLDVTMQLIYHFSFIGKDSNILS
jgi:hypothetical protein